MVQKTAGAEGRFGNGPTGQREYGRVASGSRNRAPWQTQMEEEKDTAEELERLLCLRLAFGRYPPKVSGVASFTERVA